MILVISPHLDDALLSCCDHVLAWQRQGRAVRVLTLFTAAGPWVSPVMGEGVVDGEAHMRRRRTEDADALASIGLAAEHLGLVDAGFRGNGAPHFQSLDQLLSGTTGPGGDAWVMRATRALMEHARGARRVLCPLAVGGHVDHVITRQACEAAFGPQQLGYYADMPYARAPWRWRAAQLLQVLRARRSWHWPTPAKAQVLRHYPSQLPLLFRKQLQFPELVLG